MLLNFGGQFHLTNLPDQFHHLFHLLGKERCGECKTHKGSDLAICLLCGTAVCASATPRCHLQHTKKCDGQNGMYLSVKRCDVMLVQESAWCFWGSLYLDDHGEEDLNLRRGKPLSLSKDRCDQLVELYLSVGLDDFISHKNSANPNADFLAPIFGR